MERKAVISNGSHGGLRKEGSLHKPGLRHQLLVLAES